MNPRYLALFAGLPLALALGCIEEPAALLVPNSPFGSTTPPSQALSSYAPATEKAATRVNGVGYPLLKANEQLALTPAFVTVGSPTPEVFHAGTAQIVITEGLINQCENDRQLAAVLSLELGKMASEREAQAGLATRNASREPPPTLGVGNEGGGSRGPADLVQLAEQAPFEQARKRQMHPPPPPDPKVLARLILQRAGYSDSDLSAVEPLLKTAADNSALERQMTQSHSSKPWIR